MSIKQLFLFFLLWPFLQAYAQPTTERVAYLKANAIVVRNVEPTNEDYADLAPLRQSLQQVTIIGLGEPIHHDGSAFKAKTRLVKFLHQELGFSVLAFESGFYWGGRVN
jgi:erythromycin esterase